MKTQDLDSTEKKHGVSRLIVVVLIAAAVLYGGSYYCLSRHGYREADRMGFKGFYFMAPTTRINQSLNRMLLGFYAPAIMLDLIIGTGRYPASEPLLGLSP